MLAPVISPHSYLRSLHVRIDGGPIQAASALKRFLAVFNSLLAPSLRTLGCAVLAPDRTIDGISQDLVARKIPLDHLSITYPRRARPPGSNAAFWAALAQLPLETLVLECSGSTTLHSSEVYKEVTKISRLKTLHFRRPKQPHFDAKFRGAVDLAKVELAGEGVRGWRSTYASWTAAHSLLPNE